MPSLQDTDTLQQVVDSIRDYAIFRLDTDGRIASWNVGAQLIKGYAPDEIIGQTIERFYTAEDREAGRPKRLLEVARTTGRVEDEGWRVRKDGMRFWADVIISAIRDPSGHLVGFVKITRDLSERRAQEAARLEDAARFRTIVESTRDYAIFALTPTGHVATWNLGVQRIKGYSAEEIIGRHFSTFYPRDQIDAGVCERELEIAIQEGRFENEGWRVRKDGTEFWASVVITPLFDREGGHAGFSKITRDLTDRRRWEADRLKLAHATEAVRLRDEFLSIAAHELRTPLMSLQLQLDIAQELATDPKLRGKIERANRNAQRLSDLTTALLDVGRIAAGALTLSPVTTDLSALVHDVVDRFAEVAIVAKSEVVANLDANITGVMDPMRIGQVVSNLLANAFKYAAGTRIDVALRSRDGNAVIEVRDHGPGIRAEDRERIFVRFERASAPSLGGLGLGLYVVQQIVSAHRGTISVDAPEGGGAVFTVEFPLQALAVVVEDA